MRLASHYVFAHWRTNYRPSRTVFKPSRTRLNRNRAKNLTQVSSPSSLVFKAPRRACYSSILRRRWLPKAQVISTLHLLTGSLPALGEHPSRRSDTAPAPHTRRAWSPTSPSSEAGGQKGCQKGGGHTGAAAQVAEPPRLYGPQEFWRWPCMGALWKVCQ